MVFMAILGDLAVDLVDCTGDWAGDSRDTWILVDDLRSNYQLHDHWIDHRRAVDLDRDHACDSRTLLIQQSSDLTSSIFSMYSALLILCRLCTFTFRQKLNDRLYFFDGYGFTLSIFPDELF